MRKNAVMASKWVLPVSLASFGVFWARSVYAETLTWDDCLKLAAASNPALRSAQENVGSADSQMRSNKSDYFPQLTGTVGYTYANTQTVTGSSNIVGGPVGNSSSGSYTASLTATQNIFNGLADQAKVDQGKANIGIAEATLQIAKAQVSFNLKQAFVGLDIAQKTLALAYRISGRRDQNLRMVELRFKDGQENKGNVLLYQAYLKDAHFGELQSKDNIYSSQAQLGQAIGRDDFVSLAISGSVPLHEPPSSSEPEKLALSAPLYVQAVYQLDYDEAAVVAARSAFFPTFGLSGSTGQSGIWFPDNNHWVLAATLTLPIFNGGRDYYGTKAAIATRSAAELTRNDTAHSSASALANDYTNYLESVVQLQVDQAYLDAAQVRTAIARADYGNGIMSFQDWDLVETDLITREKNILADERTRVTAEATWEQAQGKGAIP
jgi:outer membrane protein